MKWMKYTLKTTTEAVDLISGLLNELGIEGVEIEDHVPLTEEERNRMFVDILPDNAPDDGTATIHFYLEPEQVSSTMEAQIKKGLDELSPFVNVGEGSLTVSETEDKDWLNQWKEFFKPFRLSDRIVIKPIWESLASLSDRKASDVVIEIDPGTAFGTGSHETTKLCILALEKNLKPKTRILDVGCGSGILSIAAVLLGADFSLGIDIDPHTLPVAYNNRYANHISPENFQAISGNLLNHDTALQERVGFHRYDVVVANILADVILPLSKEAGRYLKPDGLFISSGILNTREEEVRDALLKNGFTVIETSHMGDWVSFVAIMKES